MAARAKHSAGTRRTVLESRPTYRLTNDAVPTGTPIHGHGILDVSFDAAIAVTVAVLTASRIVSVPSSLTEHDLFLSFPIPAYERRII